MNNKQIAKQLLADYHAGAYAHNATDNKLYFVIDDLKINCPDSFTAVRAVSEKFRKGLPWNGTTPMEHRGRKFTWPPRAPSTARVCSITTFLAFWEDGEQENAREYLRLFPRDKWPAKALEIMA